MANSHERMMKKIEETIDDYTSGRNFNLETIQEISFLECRQLGVAYEDVTGIREEDTNDTTQEKVERIKSEENVEPASYWKGYYKALEKVKELLLQ